MDNYDFVIVGSGINGLACGYEIAKKKLGVNSTILIIDTGIPFAGKKPFVLNNPNQLNLEPITDKKYNYPQNFIHPAASYNSAGILATNGATIFRSNLRKKMITSIRLYPDWLNEISDYSGENIPLTIVDDFHLYNSNNPTEFNRYKLQLERLKFEKTNDGELLSKLPNFLQKFISSKSINTILFKKNHVINPQKLLSSLVVANKKLGVKFLWQHTVVNIKKITKNFLIDITDENHYKKTIKTKRIILTTGWHSELFNQIDELKKIRLKQNPGIIKVYDSINEFPEKIILRMGGKNYLIHISNKTYYCETEKNNLTFIRIKSLLDKKNIIENRFGIRPASLDKKPILGWSNNLGIATAHRKMGIGLAPLTAKFMADNIDIDDHDKLYNGLEKFSLNRFS